MKWMLQVTITTLALSGGGLIPPAAATDVETGRIAFESCQSCHQVGPDARNGIGPHLNGIIGRPAGSVEGFEYSDAMQKASKDGMVWTVGSILNFMTHPQDVVPGTRMPFGGVEESAAREGVISYLGQFTTVTATNATGPCAGTVKEVVEIKADKEFGAYLAGECVTCHQESGHSDGIPAIAGLPRSTFVNAMCEYKVKHRSHPVMNMVAAPLGNDEMAALAAYFEALK